MVVPVPASTEPPVVVVNWCPAGEPEPKWMSMSMTGLGAGSHQQTVVASSVSGGDAVVFLMGARSRATGHGRYWWGLWPEVGFGFSAGLHTGWVPLSTMGGTLNGCIAFVAER